MALARHLIFLLCLAAVTAAIIIAVVQSSDGVDVHLRQVVFCALCFLAVIGALGFILQFFFERTAQIMASIFFGFLAGIMATNFISEIISRTTYSSLASCLTSYGLMVLLFGLSVTGLILLWVEGTRSRT
jgi:hypothetical protein